MIRATDGDELARAADFEAGVVPAVISTGDLARDRARILQDGWDFTNFRRNPVVMFNHDDGVGGLFGGQAGRMPIAASEDEHLERDRDRTVATARFDMEDSFAQRVLGKVERGLINATSVRWIPLETRLDEDLDDDGRKRVTLVFVRQELLEWSFVPLPADPGAVILRADGGPLDVATFGTDADEAGAPSLIDTLDAAHSLLESRPEADVFTDAEAEAAGRLYGLLLARLRGEHGVPAAARDEIARALDQLIAVMREVAEGVEVLQRQRVDPTRLVAEHLARVTGRSPERLHAELSRS